MPLATLLLCSPWPSGPPQCAVVGRMLLVFAASTAKCNDSVRMVGFSGQSLPILRACEFCTLR
jgi:hypothetical protein